MEYGELPVSLGVFEIQCREMMFYQYLPIKMYKGTAIDYEHRLGCFDNLLTDVCIDFIGRYGIKRFLDSYIYLTAKHLYQVPNCSFNRMGWHSDGFMTDDINYIWSNKYPTIFNKSKFNLPLDDMLSMEAMEAQALPENDVTFKECELLRLDQYNIHKVAPVLVGGMRTFVKVSFSYDKYDLVGNSHNYLLNYAWEMKERKDDRNIPQSKLNV